MARVLHIVQSLVAGGAERVVVEYALGHDRSRYEPEVCCVVGGGPLRGILEEAGVPIHFLNRGPRLNVLAVLRLAALIRRGRFDVVHDHNFTALAIGAPAAVLGGASCLIRTEHNVARSNEFIRRSISLLAAVREDAQIGVSAAVVRSHAAAHRIPRRRLVTIWNGIDDARLRVPPDRPGVREELGLEPDEVLCITVGSLTEQKDHGNLLDAAELAIAAHPRLRFFIVGHGPLEERVRTEITRRGLDGRVTMLGERLDVPRLLAASDIFALASAWEGLPIVILEAMAVSLPCVATDVGGVSEVLADGHNGFVVPPHDPRSLADRIVELAADEELRSNMAHAARSVFERGFSSDAMIRQTEALYDLATCRRASLATAERIKVLFVIRQLVQGGAERQLAELATRLPRDRYEPVVCSLSTVGPVAEECRRAGVRLISLRNRTGVFSRSSVELMRVVLRERPAIIHSYLFPANWRTAFVGKLARVPLVVTSVRNVDVHEAPFLRLVERVVGWTSDRVVVNAAAVRDYVIRHHRTKRWKVRVICNGISLGRVLGRPNPAREEPDVGEAAAGDGPEPTAPSVVMIASLTAKKDHETLFRAARRVLSERPDARFVVVGGGPLEERLRRRVAVLGVDGAVEFAGDVADVGSVLRDASVSVLTSTKEGCSNVILESMAAGRPVVATDVGGNSELIVEGRTGFLVAAQDDAAVARRILELLSDEELRREMGERGHQRVLERFTVDRMVEGTVKLYEDELEARVPGLVEWMRIAARRQAHLREGGGVQHGEA